VELNGALSNPLATGKDLQIAAAARTREAALHRAPTERSRQQVVPGRAQGSVLEAVTAALAAGERRAVREIHAEVERMLGGPVASSTIKNALADHTKGPAARFQRVRRGVYAQARPRCLSQR